MAAATLDTVVTENFGSKTLYKVHFSNIDDAQTWTSNLYNVFAYWATRTVVPTQTKEGIDVGLEQSTSIFTFYTAENTVVGDLYVLVNS